MSERIIMFQFSRILAQLTRVSKSLTSSSVAHPLLEDPLNTIELEKIVEFVDQFYLSRSLNIKR